jgi:hypothetical protein
MRSWAKLALSGRTLRTLHTTSIPHTPHTQRTQHTLHTPRTFHTLHTPHTPRTQHTPHTHTQRRGLSTVQQVFDRDLKARHRERAIKLIGGDYYDYLREESAANLVDRVEDITRSFPKALELGR